MICECKSKAFYLHLIYKHNIPLKLTIAKANALQGFCLAQIVAIMLCHFVFIPYSCYMVGFALHLYLRRLNPFPAFSSRNNIGDPSREDRETALMRCAHHLRAASGEWSNIHVGLTATTPLFEEETYRKVCRMGRDGSLFGEDEPYSSLPGSHPWPSFLTRAYGTLPTSLFFSNPNAIYWRMLHCPAAKPRVATGLRERGLLSTAHVQCGKNGVFDGVYLA